MKRATAEELKPIIAQLQSEQALLASRVPRVDAHLRSQAELDASGEDPGTVHSNDEVLQQISDRDHQRLARIGAALDRVAEERYGRCIDCEEYIELARLKSMPWALRCVSCESARERKR